MNGALGWVQGYVWPKGGSPDNTDSKLAVPFCIVVEFDDVDLVQRVILQVKNGFKGPDHDTLLYHLM